MDALHVLGGKHDRGRSVKFGVAWRVEFIHEV